jgi:hypothetical protein
MTEAQAQFIDSFNQMSGEAWRNAVAKGFREPGVERNIGEEIALAHTELSELLEGVREGNPPSSKIPEFTKAEAEAADAVIRLMDTCHARGWRLAEAIIAKHEYNLTRSFKHGKKF